MTPLLLAVLACDSVDPDASTLPGTTQPDDPSAPPPAGTTAPSAATPVAGAKTLHRLNTAEWGNTMRALFQSSLTPELSFPADNIVEGFDNNADGLATSPVLFELYEGGVDTFLDELFAIHDETTTTLIVQAEAAVHDGGVSVDGGWRLDGQGAIQITTALADDGDYQFEFFGHGLDAQATFVADGVSYGTVAVEDTQGWYGTVLPGLSAGIHTVEVQLSDGTFLVADELRLIGPLDPEVGRPNAWWDIVPCDASADDDGACIEDVLVAFAERAWRRPLAAEDIDVINAIADGAGPDWDERLRTGLKYIALAPDFAYRVEQVANGPGDTPLDAYEVATRMAFFLWSQGPDDALLAAAADGSLLDPEVRSWHINRMLDDARAEALVTNFAGQWLAIRQISSAQPDPALYPEFSPEFEAAMIEEVQALARNHLLADANLLDLLTTQESWGNSLLAEHYGVAFDGTTSGPMSLEGTPRGGLLTTAGWLATRAHPDRPSTVLRGKWVLDNLLCTPIPPPPPEAGNLGPIVPDILSIREQEELARGDTFCQGCHTMMDPIGFTLHHFDSIGGFRATDEIGFPIDASGTIAGAHVGSIVDYRPLLTANPLLPRCVVIKAMTYGLGRTVGDADVPLVDALTDEFVASGHRFSSLVGALIESPAFLQKGPAQEAE